MSEKTYLVGEVSKITGLSIPTLRYYDRMGLFPNLKKDPSGVRHFSEKDLQSLKLIECLKRTGMELLDIRTFIRWTMKGDSTIPQRRQLFESRREAVHRQLEEIQLAMKLIEYKCWYYETAEKEGTTSRVENLKPEDMPEKIRELYEATLGAKGTEKQ